MTLDLSRLKALAEAAMLDNSDMDDYAAFRQVAGPDVILALIAELEEARKK